MKYQAVIFDLFGTIIDSFPAQAFEQMLAEMAAVLDAPPQGFAQVWFATFEQKAAGGFATMRDVVAHVCRQLDLQPTLTQIDSAAAIRAELTRQTLPPRPGALETMAQLKTTCHKIGLITNCAPEVPELWPASAFAPFFDVMVFSCAVKLVKPDPCIYQAACESLGVTPQDCLYVGDGSNFELTGAAGVGMSPILIRVPGDAAGWESYRRDAAEWRGPVVGSLPEILAFIE